MTLESISYVCAEIDTVIFGICFVYCIIRIFTCKEKKVNRFILLAILFKVCEICSFLHVELRGI